MQLEKGEFFVTAVFFIYFVQFLWIALEVIVRLKTIEEVGELYFIYSMYNMMDILYYSLQMMKAGIQINKLDLILKASFMRLSKESSRI